MSVWTEWEGWGVGGGGVCVWVRLHGRYSDSPPAGLAVPALHTPHTHTLTNPHIVAPLTHSRCEDDVIIYHSMT